MLKAFGLCFSLLVIYEIWIEIYIQTLKETEVKTVLHRPLSFNCLVLWVFWVFFTKDSLSDITRDGETKIFRKL